MIRSTTAEIAEFSLSFDEIEHDPAGLIALLGYRDGEAPELLRTVLEEIISDAGDRCHIRGGYRHISEIEWRETDLCLGRDKMALATGKIIADELQRAESVALFACTIGTGLETWSKRLMNDGDFFAGYLVDAVASLTVESAMQKIQDYLEREQQDKGLRISNCYSPGNCGWPVTEQHKLFSLLPDNFCGITLTDSSLMLPIKSVSGIIGIGPAMRKVNTCQFCDMKRCVYRRRFEKSKQEI
ncbi:5-methyltetrahydrofolate--homocysteine methyltransferase [candidate division KSB1 bacterium]|nr:5-methyltetrahydrofolate--homocysteine methyltransferase [candidate division KSB1 bacterium]